MSNYIIPQTKDGALANAVKVNGRTKPLGYWQPTYFDEAKTPCVVEDVEIPDLSVPDEYYQDPSKPATVLRTAKAWTYYCETGAGLGDSTEGDGSPENPFKSIKYALSCLSLICNGLALKICSGCNHAFIQLKCSGEADYAAGVARKPFDGKRLFILNGASIKATSNYEGIAYYCFYRINASYLINCTADIGASTSIDQIDIMVFSAQESCLYNCQSIIANHHVYNVTVFSCGRAYDCTANFNTSDLQDAEYNTSYSIVLFSSAFALNSTAIATDIVGPPSGGGSSRVVGFRVSQAYACQSIINNIVGQYSSNIYGFDIPDNAYNNNGCYNCVSELANTVCGYLSAFLAVTDRSTCYIGNSHARMTNTTAIHTAYGFWMHAVSNSSHHVENCTATTNTYIRNMYGSREEIVGFQIETNAEHNNDVAIYNCNATVICNYDIGSSDYHGAVASAYGYRTAYRNMAGALMLNACTAYVYNHCYSYNSMSRTNVAYGFNCVATLYDSCVAEAYVSTGIGADWVGWYHSCGFTYDANSLAYNCTSSPRQCCSANMCDSEEQQCLI